MYDLISALILVAIILALAVMFVGMLGLTRRPRREPPDHGWTYGNPPPAPINGYSYGPLRQREGAKT